MGKNYAKKLAALAKEQEGIVASGSQIKSISSAAEKKPGVVFPHKILRIITEEEAYALRPSREESVGVVTVVPRIFEKEIQVLTVTEDNSFNKGFVFTKLPSFTMKARDESLSDCLIREGISEVDRVLGKFDFVCGAEFKTSIPGERHHKLCFIAREFGNYPVSAKIVSKADARIKTKTREEQMKSAARDTIFKRRRRRESPIYVSKEPDILSIQWMEIRKAFEIIPKSQKTMVGPIVEKLKTVSYEFWSKLPDIKSSLPFMEGVYDLSLFQLK